MLKYLLVLTLIYVLKCPVASNFLFEMNKMHMLKYPFQFPNYPFAIHTVLMVRSRSRRSTMGRAMSTRRLLLRQE